MKINEGIGEKDVPGLDKIEFSRKCSLIWLTNLVCRITEDMSQLKNSPTAFQRLLCNSPGRKMQKDSRLVEVCETKTELKE